jgi:hypothetical protein
MNILIATLESVVLLIGIGLIGFAIIAKKIVPRDILKVITPLVIEIALPCLIFTNIVKFFEPAKTKQWWTFPFWWLALAVVLTLLTIIFMQLVQKKFRSEFGLSLLYPNGIFFTVAIIPRIFGLQTPLLAELFLFILLFPAFVFNTYYLFFRNNRQKFAWSKLFNPIMLATIIGVILKLMKIDVFIPDVFIDITERVGQLSLPLIMLLIGGNIYLDFSKRGEIYWLSVGKFVLIKNVLFPLIILGLLVLVRPSLNLAILIFLQAVVPPLTAVPVFAERAGGNAYIVNQYLVASFIFAIISIPLLMALFGTFFNLPQ